jgi:hypothetical protein
MTIDIKQSWFIANWNKPKRMKRHFNRYIKKYSAISSAMGTIKRFKIEGAEVKTFEKNCFDKLNFYHRQSRKLFYVMNAYLNGELTDQNKNIVINDIFNDKFYFLKSRPEGYPKYKPLIIEPKKEMNNQKTSLFGKILNKIIQ